MPFRLLQCPIVGGAFLILLQRGAVATLAHPVVVFPLSSGQSANSITAGPDGFLWFTEGAQIGRIIPSGVLAGNVHDFDVPSFSQTNGITAGPDGSLWFTECGAVGRIEVSGRVTEFPVPDTNCDLTDITTGPDGNLWFTETDINQIGRITPTGTVTEFPLPTEFSGPNGITSGPDGNLWFTEDDANQIGRINPHTGTVDEFPILTEGALSNNALPKGIVAGPDGYLWFTEVGANQIGRISLAGSLIEFPLPTEDSSPLTITVGSDGNLWFTEYDAEQIGRITRDGIVDEFSLVPTDQFTPDCYPGVITSGPDGNLWFTCDDASIGALAPRQVTPFLSPTPTPTVPSPTPTATLPVPTPTPTATPIFAPPRCAGDCNGNGSVEVNEVLSMVNIALGAGALSNCRAGDADGNAAIDVGELVQAVQHTLNGCPVAGICGDRVVDAVEDCDDGGICIGGTNAGTVCTSEGECVGQGVCLEGVKAEAACDRDSDCPGSRCAHCVPQGGDGCAANCTTETDVPFNLLPGVVAGGQLTPGTSGAFVHDGLLQLPLALRGAETLTIGKQRDGRIPVVVKASSVQFPRIAVAALACACVRGVVAKTCGGTLFEADGVTLSTSCTAGFTAGDSLCAGQKPCTFVSGPENSAAGTIGCNGLDATNLSVTRQSGGLVPPPPPPILPAGSGPEIITLNGSGEPGAALIFNATAIGTVTGTCSQTSGALGPDAQFCTADDPQSYRGTLRTLPSVTGTATGVVLNSFSSTQADHNIGPFSVTGSAFDCARLTAASPSAAGGSLVVVFTSLNQPVLGDVLVTTQLTAE